MRALLSPDLRLWEEDEGMEQLCGEWRGSRGSAESGCANRTPLTLQEKVRDAVL